MCEENDMTSDRDDSEDCHGSNDAMDLNMNDKNVVAFPHEHHWTLTQEFLAVFGGPGKCHFDRHDPRLWCKAPRSAPLQWQGNRGCPHCSTLQMDDGESDWMDSAEAPGANYPIGEARQPGAV